MPSKLDDLLPLIIGAGETGLTLSAMKTKFVGKSANKERAAALQDKLVSLVRGGAISGPFKHGGAQRYFAAGHGPSIETASAVVVSLVSRSGVKLLSKPGLEKKVTGLNKRFFSDGLKHAVANQAIVELSCGSSKYYLHRDVAADYFGFEATPSDPAIPVPPPSPAAAPLTLERMLPAYRRLKAEQGGFSAVKIFDLMRALDGAKDDLHRLLLEEAKAGRVSIHPTTSVELPKEVIDAGIRLPGQAEPFVTVVVKNEP
jgi:hypothetical protein